MQASPFDELEFFRAIAERCPRAPDRALGPPEARAELEAWENRRLSREEFEQRVNAPWTEREREDFAALCAWFNRRYPTPGERLRAIRHLAAQWARNRPR